MNASLHSIPWRTARYTLSEGDLLLFRRRGLISLAGRGVHSHAAKAARWGDDWFCLEVREFKGGRAVTLESQVRRNPGRIDVYAAGEPSGRWPRYDRHEAVAYMRRLAGCEYGWWSVLGTALLHLPVIRWFYRPSLDDLAKSSRPPFCSQAVAMAERLGGGVDPVPNLSDFFVEPADLARSPFYRYRFTLVP